MLSKLLEAREIKPCVKKVHSLRGTLQLSETGVFIVESRYIPREKKEESKKLGNQFDSVSVKQG